MLGVAADNDPLGFSEFTKGDLECAGIRLRKLVEKNKNDKIGE